MSKYFYVYKISLQNVLQRRASLLMDRVGGIAVLLALYYFWSSLFQRQPSFLGYSRAQMLSYVLMMNILRSFVFTGRGWELVQEISTGRISQYLVRPVNYQMYCLSLDMAQKTVHLGSALIEVGVLIFFFSAPLYIPQHWTTWIWFLISFSISSLIFYCLEFMVSSLAFWTSESGGPLFCFELFLQFAAGTFFPLDVLPGYIQRALQLTPFPYIVYYPLQIYLERPSMGFGANLEPLAIQAAWLILIYFLVQAVWQKGLRTFAAEGG